MRAASTKVEDRSRSRRGERPGHVRRRRRQGVEERGRGRTPSSTGWPGPTPGDPAASSGSCRPETMTAGHRSPVDPAVARLRSALLGAVPRRCRSPLLVAARWSSAARWRRRSAQRRRPGCSDAEPGHDRDQPGPDGRARHAARPRPGAPAVPRRLAARDDRRPADRPAAVGRGARAAARLRAARHARRAARRRSASSCRSRRVAVVLAQTFVSAPFFIRSARAGFARRRSRLEDAARVDGASERQLFRAITAAARRAGAGGRAS